VKRVDDEGMSREHEVGPVAELPSGAVAGAGGYAVGNIGGELFAVSRRCRHLGADLANGTLDEEGRLVCPWHQSAYKRAHRTDAARAAGRFREGARVGCLLRGADPRSAVAPRPSP
jgi:Rieske Fe-S protein